jgi:hypothetical protein
MMSDLGARGASPARLLHPKRNICIFESAP